MVDAEGGGNAMNPAFPWMMPQATPEAGPGPGSAGPAMPDAGRGTPGDVGRVGAVGGGGLGARRPSASSRLGLLERDRRQRQSKLGRAWQAGVGGGAQANSERPEPPPPPPREEPLGGGRRDPLGESIGR